MLADRRTDKGTIASESPQSVETQPLANSTSQERAKLCYVATSSATVHTFLRGLAPAMSQRFDVTVICDSDDMRLIEDIETRFIFVPIQRKISLWRDLAALIRIVRIFRRERYEIVHSIMPKAGLLAMIAGIIARVPIRIHMFSGQVWATSTGLWRTMLIFWDRVIHRCSTLILVDSETQRQYLIAEGIISRERSRTIGQGSICGVDLARFHPSPDRRASVRRTLGIADDDFIVLFAGRLNRDKGIVELANAFNRVASKHANAHLLVVAAEEDVTFAHIRQICAGVLNRVHLLPFSTHPEIYMAASEVYCLPSYREGMPMSVLESAACGIPSAVSRIYGTRDAVIPDVTGLVFEPGDVESLSQALSTLREDEQLRNKLGRAAFARAVESFSTEVFHREIDRTYRELRDLRRSSPAS